VLTSNGYLLDERSSRLGQLVETPRHERADRDALWERLRAQGYLYLPGQIPVEEVAAFRTYYFSALASARVTRTGTDPADGVAGDEQMDAAAFRRALYDVIVPSAEYETLCAMPAIRGWFAWFLDDDVHLHKRKIIRQTKPGETGIGTATQAHYDLVYLREGTDRVLSMWIPLGDTPVTLGGLTYLEGSHQVILAEEREGRLKRPAASITADLPGLADEHDARWLVTDYRAGDVVVHSAHIVHASLDNVDPDGRIRLSTDIRYQRTSDPIDWRWQQHWHDSDGL
jgi:hypothetical protein